MSMDYANNSIQQYEGDPTGHVVPLYPGSLCLDRENFVIYQATGEADTDWQVAGSGAYTALVIPTTDAGLPSGAIWNDSGTLTIVS